MAVVSCKNLWNYLLTSTKELSMLFGAAGQSFSMIILAVMVRSSYEQYTLTHLIPAQDKLGGKGPGIVAALFLFLFNTFFAIGWLGMTWLYPAEIVPLRIRAPANALATSANWVRRPSSRLLFAR